jgi:hypothetical protein
MKKKLVVVFLAVIIAFTGLPAMNVSAGVYDDFNMSYSIDEKRILEGDIFTLYHSVKLL